MQWSDPAVYLEMAFKFHGWKDPNNQCHECVTVLQSPASNHVDILEQLSMFGEAAFQMSGTGLILILPPRCHILHPELLIGNKKKQKKKKRGISCGGGKTN